MPDQISDVGFQSFQATLKLSRTSLARSLLWCLLGNLIVIPIWDMVNISGKPKDMDAMHTSHGATIINVLAADMAHHNRP